MPASCRFIIGAAIAGLAAACLFSVQCTVKEEKRKPGPLVVWLYAEPDAEHYYRILVEDFEKETAVPVKLVFKESYEMRALLLNHPEDLKSEVDLIEADLFDLDPAAPHMEDLRPFLKKYGHTYGIAEAPMRAGEFNGRQRFLPWRLSWPAMVMSNRIGKAPVSWLDFKRLAEKHSGDVLIPGLDDRELFAFVCSVIWAHGADPTDPFDKKLLPAFEWLSGISGHLRMESGATRSSEIASYPSGNRPALFFTWPEGLIPLILDGSLKMELTAAPFPCGKRGRCVVLFFGRYLGVPRGAAHSGDALNFIDFMLSPRFQRQMIFAQPWLPASNSGWGDLGPRQNGYNALTPRSNNLKGPSPDLKKIEQELTRAGRRLLYEGTGPWTAITEYRDALLED